MNIQEYRQRNRKKITCPSGLELEIKKIQTLDFLAIGLMPDTFQQIIKDKAPDIEIVKKMNIMFLVRGVVSNENIRLVDKPIGTTAENELSIEELDDIDMQFIVSEVSKLTMGDRLNAEPFREEQMVDDSGQNGNTIRSTTEPDITP